MSRVVSAYSGGIDSTWCLDRLHEIYGFPWGDIIPVCVDVGQGQEEIETAKERAKLLILEDNLKIVDAKERFVEEYIHRAIKANGSYCGSEFPGYPMGTSMTRVLVTEVAMGIAKEEDATAFCHGCTGKGNDQYRMEQTAKYFDPNIKIIAPVKELDVVRGEEEEMLKTKYEIERKVGRRQKLGGDVNMWSNSRGSGDVDNLTERYENEHMWVVLPENAPDEKSFIEIKYEMGIPVEISIDGKSKTDPVNMILALNEHAGKYGVGWMDIIETQMSELKSRELYEAPAAVLILRSHKDLETLTLTKSQLRRKHENLDHEWSNLVYHGYWFDPAKRSIDAFNDEVSKKVNGKETLELFKGNVTIIERESKDSLFRPDIRSLRVKSIDQRAAVGATQLASLHFALLGERERNR